jgi:hypothetical protein
VHANTGTAADTFDIGLHTNGTAPDTWSLAGISSKIYLNGGAGIDTVNVGNNDGSAAGNVTSQLANGVFTSSATRFNNDSTIHFHNETSDATAAYVTVEVINITMGSGIDQFSVNDSGAIGSPLPSWISKPLQVTIDTAAGNDVIEIINTALNAGITTGQNELRIKGGADHDLFTVRAIQGRTWIDGDSGNDQVYVGSVNQLVQDIDASLIIYGGIGTDTINVDNQQSTTNADNAASTAAGLLSTSLLTGLDMGGGITYYETEDLNIILGSGRDHFTVSSTHTGTTDISGNAGSNSDQFVVKTVSGNTSMSSGDGADTITVGDTVQALAGIQKVLSIDAGAGSDSLILNNVATSTQQSGRLSDSRLSGFDMLPDGMIDFVAIETLELNLGSGVDNLAVDSTINGTTTIETGAGSDTVKIETYFGLVHLNTGDDSDTITVFDGVGDNAGSQAVLNIDGGNAGDIYSINVAQSIQGVPT